VAFKFNKQSLEDFHERLSSVDASWQEDFTLKEIVRKSLKPISKARRYKVSWDKIAFMLQEATGGELEISAASVRQYYFELTGKPSKKEKTNRSKQSSAPSQKTSSKIPTADTEEHLETSQKYSENSVELSPKEPSETSSNSHETSQQRLPEPNPDAAEKHPEKSSKSTSKPRRQSQSEIQSSFNLRRP
jgi:hypothetical protein